MTTMENWLWWSRFLLMISEVLQDGEWMVACLDDFSLIGGVGGRLE
jgi:hypothetical protein